MAELNWTRKPLLTRWLPLSSSHATRKVWTCSGSAKVWLYKWLNNKEQNKVLFIRYLHHAKILWVSIKYGQESWGNLRKGLKELLLIRILCCDPVVESLGLLERCIADWCFGCCGNCCCCCCCYFVVLRRCKGVVCYVLGCCGEKRNCALPAIEYDRWQWDEERKSPGLRVVEDEARRRVFLFIFFFLLLL